MSVVATKQLNYRPISSIFLRPVGTAALSERVRGTSGSSARLRPSGSFLPHPTSPSQHPVIGVAPLEPPSDMLFRVLRIVIGGGTQDWYQLLGSLESIVIVPFVVCLGEDQPRITALRERCPPDQQSPVPLCGVEDYTAANHGVIPPMSTTHEDEVFKLTLLSNQNDQAQLGPFDGLVAALLDDGVHFITSPNQPMIPMPPLGAREVRRCIDARFGMDDYIQWPQPYCSNTPHYACIPRLEIVQDLHAAINPILDRARLSVSPDTAVAHTVGVFISIHHVAHVYHRARLPFWFIEKRTSFSDQNIMIVIELTPPESIIETATVDRPIPYVSTMAAQSIKYNDPFQAPAPSQPTPSTSLAPTPQTVPQRHTLFSSTSTPQIHNPRLPAAHIPRPSSLKSSSKHSRQSKSRGRHIKPDKAPGSKTPPLPPSFFPFSIQSWTQARASVNTDFTLVQSQQQYDDKKTYFPDISMFITGSPLRNKRWLNIWTLVRGVCISRVETSFASACPLTYQEWRTFLFATPSSQMDSVRDAMAPTLSAYGIPLESLFLVPDGEMPSDDIARGMLWEMAEYNFRCDILLLHGRMRRPDVPDTIGDERLAAALSTHPDISGIFDVDRSSADSGLGLASPVPQTRLLVLRTLCQLMQCWQGDRPPILNVDDSSTSRPYVAELESAITAYFCQTFFNNFGRVPSIPFSLHPILP
ncbi:hypothetical protein BDN72DRAFT_865738 [Pluteus cervinus]|uniref:Uncharacterized protein n=1 Tax=Pluteus cervinus TaxID=181527 RepID=A0ACD2ZZG3_9AGAR|nr:hypothetical protein BDN72DRAFT_865738 [Pluteus cervinus]